MSYPLIFFNTKTGKLVLNNSIDVETQDDSVYLPLMTNTPVGACVAIVEHTAIRINSLYNNPIILRQSPIVDGIVLTPGNTGDIVKIANKYGCIYTSTYYLSPGNKLYLGKNGLLTTELPSIQNGDIWYVEVGERVNEYDFIFAPNDPVLLSNPSEIDLTIRFDYISEELGYKGEAAIGSLESDPVWKICKIVIELNGDIKTLWANGSGEFTNIWNNRLSLVYS